MIIRGFSEFTSYNCAHCHSKCCATEYDLPLFPHESDKLCKNYEYSSFFIQSTDRGKRLIRGDSCPFLTSQGLCLLHNTQNKPLMCQVYPLILWRIKPDIYLCWIHPCRGNGFQWLGGHDHQITDHYLTELIVNVQNYFESYWGDQIDLENPFTDVSYKRVQQEFSFFKQRRNVILVDKITEVNESGDFSDYFHSIREVLRPSSQHPELNTVINAVLHWLSWSPVSLKLTFPNSKVIFMIAAMWIELHGSLTLSRVLKPSDQKRYLNQLGSLLATSVMPSFWSYIERNGHNESVKKFSIRVRKILSGKIPQQSLNDLKGV
ncbi:MAG: YkgJ family cysteine cluster protein [Candidatus Heimdallarchaeota archaeon]|nr:MAG: YkgJ family cysteine cluster protein [Candidatus Heimdallarchaeota archaeon]